MKHLPKYVGIGLLFTSVAAGIGFTLGRETGRHEVVQGLEQKVNSEIERAGGKTKTDSSIEIDPYMLGKIRGVEDCLRELKIHYQIGNWQSYLSRK